MIYFWHIWKTKRRHYNYYPLEGELTLTDCKRLFRVHRKDSYMPCKALAHIHKSAQICACSLAAQCPPVQLPTFPHQTHSLVNLGLWCMPCHLTILPLCLKSHAPCCRQTTMLFVPLSSAWQRKRWSPPPCLLLPASLLWWRMMGTIAMPIPYPSHQKHPSPYRKYHTHYFLLVFQKNTSSSWSNIWWFSALHCSSYSPFFCMCLQGSACRVIHHHCKCLMKSNRQWSFLK